MQIKTERRERTKIQLKNVWRRGLEHDLVLVVVLQTVWVLAVAAIFRATRGLHVRRAPWLGAERAQKRGRVRRTRADLHVVRLNDGAALLVPVGLQAQDGFLKSDH